MLASSIINSVVSKTISGNFPNTWNTLHENRKQNNAKIIPFYQKFHSKSGSDHVLYLQFESDVDADIVIKMINKQTLVEIETVTVKWSDVNGGRVIGLTTPYTRYYTNFVITLDSAYYDKFVYFTATQGTDVLTSEPIYITDLTEDVEKGIVKYVKYSNFDRIDSDLDSKFIDWESLTNTGKYMDMYIDALDVELNDRDEVEVLQGSQSSTIVSAAYFTGRTLKTDALPDYMIAKLGVISSLDMFLINDIQYIKDGEIDVERLGSSTSFQATLKLTQKNTIGINVDNLGLAGEIVVPIPPPVEDPPLVVYPMYIGSFIIPPAESMIKLMTEVTDYKSNQTYNYTIVAKKFVFAYPASYGDLISILDNTGLEIISGFTKTVMSFTQGLDAVSYNRYVFNRKSTVTDFDITYKFV